MITISFNIKNLITIAIICLLIYITYIARQVILIGLFGMLLAYMISPLVQKLAVRKIPYPIATSAVMFAMISLVIYAGLWLIPQMFSDIERFSRDLPSYASFLFSKLTVAGEYLHIDLSSASLYNRALAQISASGVTFLKTFGNVMGSIQYAVSVTMNIVLVPVIAFFILIDYPKTLNFLDKYMGKTKDKGIRKYISLSSDVFSSYFRGQFTVMAILCVLYSLALTVVGLDAAILMGTVTGLLSIVPYLGFGIGIVVSVVLAAVQFQDVLHPVYVIIGYTAVQLLESFVITPKVVGNSVGLHPVATIILLLVGGTVFGIIGMVFVLPVAAIIFKIYKDKLIEYEKTKK